ncbi:multidrug effflux MFS transporter [Shewanella sp. JM162201]|uniref:Bcr/CflA family efflux transporter n=1 Tax=Shewanella jiangmenensis TaxID=2837387 RepID=A0ABS5V888_9GAMM|nr:multidrug effflux MFS transporter [Shewanella jiangmenensis]
MQTGSAGATSAAVKPWLIPLLASIVAITPLAIDMYLPAMAAIAASLHSDITGVQQSLSVYLAGYACGLLLFGPLADKYGRRPLVLLGLGGFALLSLGLVFSPDLESFFILRFFQAMIGSAATVAVPGYVKILYGANTAKGMSYVSLIMMLAPLIAPGIGSFILGVSHWQMVFYVLASYAAITLLLVYFCLHIPEQKLPKSERPGFAKAYKIVLTRPGVKGFISSGVLTSFAFFCYLTASPFVFMQVFGLDSHHFAMVFAANVGALMLANVLNSRIVGRFGSLRLLRASTLLASLFGLGLTLANLADFGLYGTLACLVPLMACLGIMSVNADAIVLLKFQHETGTATAVIGTLRFGVGALAGPLLALLYNGSALPFSVLMLLSVLLAGVCQYLARQTA